MVDYSNAKIKMQEAVAEKLFKIGSDQVAILRWKCVISAGGGVDQEYIKLKTAIVCKVSAFQLVTSQFCDRPEWQIPSHNNFIL